MIELSIIAKATAILVLGLLAAGFAQKARASVRHAIVGATLVVLLILPVALLTLPELTVRVPIAQANSPTPVFEAVSRDASQGSSPTTPTVATAARNFDTSPTTIIRIVWATGAALLLLSLTGSLWRLRQLRRTGLPWIELTGEIAKWRDGEMAKWRKC